MHPLTNRAVRLVALGLCLGAGTASGQYALRDKLVGVTGTNVAMDASGRSIKVDRVRAIHTTDNSLEGGTAYLIQKDPFLAYQLGRNLNFREFRVRDGVLGKGAASQLGGPMPDGTTAKLTTNNTVGCLACHNAPDGNPGGGINLAKDSGFGRQAPHYYGAGLVEMIGIQTRTKMLQQLDTNLDGWVSAAEAAAAGPSLTVVPAPGEAALDFGDPQLDGGLTGKPSFNNIVVVWYVDGNGVHVPGATGVDGVTTFGYDFELVVWGWGQGAGRGALNPTNRAFLWDPFNAHSGLDAYDPTSNSDPDGDGLAAPSLSGAIQFPATHKSPDRGVHLHANGYSLDDPDGDEYLNEISEGDLDLGEWFMLNVPAPAFRGTPAEYDDGVALLDGMDCTSCHTADWKLEAQGGDFAGDRRLFDFPVTWNDAAQEFQGKLVPLWTQVGDVFVPNRGEYTVSGVFCDFRHHDLGPEMHEIGYDGVVNRPFRTAPLWGVGSGFPWGHDGRSLTLDDVIRRHGGEAAASRALYLGASVGDRQALLRFLGNLQLYDIESLPADISGDDIISNAFVVQGKDTGYERFNAEWLFKIPVRIQGDVLNANGQLIKSSAGTNIRNAYGTDLAYLKDNDGDGWPDVWDPNDTQVGYKNGKK
ncbi:MAG: hypothetical protein H6825_09475 [Planctomycetes bacterium]|nr:hypothetical protein [Planctomycetota bacterium]